MNRRSSFLVAMLLASAVLACAGCSMVGDTGMSPPPEPSPAPSINPSMAPAGTPAASGSPVIPGGTYPASPAGTSTPPVSPAPARTPWVPVVPSLAAANDPQIVVLNFTRNYYLTPIPDCGMREAFPEIAKNPEYGITSSSPTLVGLTEDRLLAFQRRYAIPYSTEEMRVDPYLDRHTDPHIIGGALCAGVPANPTWNFILVNATLIPRNARPAEYAIGINLKSHDRIVAQLNMNRTLVLDQPVVYGLFVPLKTGEMDSFDRMEMAFNRTS